MPLGHILTKQALNTLTQLHAELAGKISDNKTQGKKLRAQMIQVEAVMKLLDPEVSVRGISAKRRVTGNPWFKRGKLYRAALDVLRKATGPMTVSEIISSVLTAKGITATHEQFRSLEAGLRGSLNNHDGKGIERVGEGSPHRWLLSQKQ